jgi:Rieske Fe-S protein
MTHVTTVAIPHTVPTPRVAPFAVIKLIRSGDDVSPIPQLNRRTVVVGGAVLLGTGLATAACAGGPPPEPAAPAAGTVLGPTSAVPVGSATIFTAQQVVVTQATKDAFRGFSTTCPHQGCPLSQVQGATITCPCHGSQFALDGSVTRGPAQQGLAPEAVTVQDGQLVMA